MHEDEDNFLNDDFSETFNNDDDDVFDFDISDDEEVRGVLYRDTINATPELSRNPQTPPAPTSSPREGRMKRSEIFQQHLQAQELETAEEEWIPSNVPFGSPSPAEPKIVVEDGEVIKILPGGSYLVAERKESFSQIFLRNLIIGSAIAIPFGVAIFLLYIFIGPKI